MPPVTPNKPPLTAGGVRPSTPRADPQPPAPSAGEVGRPLGPPPNLFRPPLSSSRGPWGSLHNMVATNPRTPSGAATSPHVPTLQERSTISSQEGAQGQEDPFPMEEGWESLAIFSDTSPELVGDLAALPSDGIAEVQSKKIAQSMRWTSEAQAAEQSILQYPSSPTGFTQALKVAAGVATRFVEVQAQIPADPHASLADVQEAQRKCYAGKEAVLAVASACSREKAIEVQTKLSNAINLEKKSPAQASAEIAVKAVESVLAYPDLHEVTVAATGSAAAIVLLAMNHAIELRPSDRQEIKNATQIAMKNLPEGQAVLAFLAGVRQANLMGSGA